MMRARTEAHADSSIPGVADHWAKSPAWHRAHARATAVRTGLGIGFTAGSAEIPRALHAATIAHTRTLIPHEITDLPPEARRFREEVVKAL